jgi:oligopeptide transport system substrate-binding protein
LLARLGAVVAAVLAVASLAGCGGGVLSPDVVVVNAAEPPNPLIPTGTNDRNGGPGA